MSEPAWVPLGGAVGGDVVYEGAWSNTVAYQPGDVVTYQGVTYLAVNPSTGQTPPGVSAPITSYSTSPPLNPKTGDIWQLPFDATAGVVWTFRYNAGSSSAYKWEFVGGPPAETVAGTVTLTTTGVWTDLGANVTVPRAGDYRVEGRATGSHSFAGGQHWIAAAAGATIGSGTPQQKATAGYTGVMVAMETLLAVAAGSLVGLRFYNSSAGTVTWTSTVAHVMPVRVS